MLAQAPIQPAKSPEPTKQELISYATKQAVAADISPSTVLGVISCESNFDTHAVGDKGTSFGLVQIHNPEEKGLKVWQTEEPYFAINYLIDGIKSGHGNQWSCYRKMAEQP